MKPKIKKRWLAAIRSGEYEQGTSHLKMGNKFCCLGILCDLYLKEKGQKWTTEDDSEEGVACGTQTSYLPLEVMDWAGLKRESPHAGGHALSTHNDGRESGEIKGKSFEEIADIIEKEKAL